MILFFFVAIFNQLEKLQQQQKVSRAVQTMICRDILRRNMVDGSLISMMMMMKMMIFMMLVMMMLMMFMMVP